MFRKNKGENKTKLEHKLYLARETPEPVFDLSDCGITNVPSGIYSLCRVFLKDCLKLDNNNLSSLSGGGNLQDLHLLKILDIHANEFSSLPNEVDLLINLRVMLVSKNQLKKLPSSLCNLRHLEILDVSENKLKNLPENIGNLNNLRELNIVGNKSLKELPKSICKAQNLCKLELDFKNFIYPPLPVCENGTTAIVKFITDDTGYVCDQTDNIDSPDSGTINLDDLNFQAKIWKFEKIKEQKVREFLEIEKQNEISQQKELELANSLKVDKLKLLDDISRQQNKLDFDIAKIHEEKELDRFKLVEQLQIVEQNADIAINILLNQNKEPLALLLEIEKLEEERIINAANECCNQLRKADILNAMQEMIEQETKSFTELTQIRDEAAQNILEKELQSNDHLARLLEIQTFRQSEILSKIQEDIDLQKAAVRALLERGDARSWGLIQQVRLVEVQLAALTSIEMDRHKLKIDKHINDLSEKRVNLSMLLMDLLDQQSCRRIQLFSTIELLEEKNDTSEDFWLRQYQQLMDRMPAGVTETHKNMNPSLVEALLMAGVWHCIPFLVKWSNNESKLLKVTEKDLKDAGLNPQDSEKILQAFYMYTKQRYSVDISEDRNAIPSAPTEEVVEASAPPIETTGFVTNECVICLDVHCQMIFVPCGHFCCCISCASSMRNCPLCRGDIEHKIRVVPV